MAIPGWKDTTLGEVISLQRGYDLPIQDQRPGDYHIMGSAGPNGTHNVARSKGPGVVIGRSGVGSMGVASYCKSDFWPHNTTLFVTDFRGNDPRFVFYFLTRLNLRGYDSGSAQASLNRNFIYPIDVSIPGPAEQRQISHILGSLDDKIEQNRRTGAKLEELARATFKAWFVDFEPVQAKAAGATAFPGMPPETFSVLPETFQDSPIGQVPKGWEVKAFGELVESSSERVGSASVPAYSSTNDGLCPRSDQFRKELSKSLAKNLLIRRGDLVFGNSRNALNFGMMYDAAGAVSQVYKVFRPRGSTLTPRYIETMIRERVGYYRQIIKSTTRDNQGIMADFFLQLSILVPPATLRQAYAAVEEPMRQLIEHLQCESAKLATLRDYLLPRLLSGRLRVADSDQLAQDME